MYFYKKFYFLYFHFGIFHKSAVIAILADSQFLKFISPIKKNNWSNVNNQWLFNGGFKRWW